MKNSIITFLLGFFFLISCFKAISNSSSFIYNKPCLEIDGKISNVHDDKIVPCTIQLISSNKVMASIILKGKKNKFKFLLEKGMTYTIKITKPGYVTRLVCVDTKMEATADDLYGFSFETKLIKESDSEGLNKEYLDFPIAMIFFDSKKEFFVYDKEYTSKIKKEVVMK